MKKIAILILCLALLPICGCSQPKKSVYVVGVDIEPEDVTEFYCTVSTSTYPPHYQRYRFYKEDGAYKFFHETREGDHFPLTEADATVSETTELSGDQWSDFLVLLVGGRVIARQEHLEAGDDGPWLYLYWTGDRGDIQEFSFVSRETQSDFEALCESLAGEAPEAAAETEPPTPEPTPSPTPESTPSPTPSPTPVPEPTHITIGCVGDIMIPSGIVSDTRMKDGTYDYHTLFAPFIDLFGSVDLMCANLEAPLAGPEARYSTKNDPKPGEFRFNAPDSVLEPLKEYGVDLLTTGNNHCLDKGVDGLLRTIETIRAAGFYHTGTFLSAEDKQVPCIINVQGVRVGFVTVMRTMNVDPSTFGIDDGETYLYNRLDENRQPRQGVLDDIKRLRENGAEFVILFAHWDYEKDGPAEQETRDLAKLFLEAGADCIVGSHPHRVKDAEYITVEREDGPYTGLVLYSLGNFTANNRFKLMVGLYTQLTLEKDYGTGKVTLCDAAVLPTLTIKRDGQSKPRIVVMPAYKDPERITGLNTPLTGGEINSLKKARALALEELGSVEGVRVLDETDE